MPLIAASFGAEIGVLLCKNSCRASFTIACSYAAAEGAEVSFDQITHAWTDLHGSAAAA